MYGRLHRELLLGFLCIYCLLDMVWETGGFRMMWVNVLTSWDPKGLEEINSVG